jgi:6-phosphogluconolactonase (cycloisomerase 2 family)
MLIMMAVYHFPLNFNLGVTIVGLAMTHDDKYVYATDTTNNQILVFSRDNDGNLLQLLQYSIKTGKSPQLINISDDDQNLYVANQLSGNISQYKINHTTGQLNSLSVPKVKSGYMVQDVIISHDGKNAYAISYAEQSIYLYNRDTTTGLLTKLESQPTIKTGKFPVNIIISNNDKYIYVDDEDSAIYQYIRLDDGMLISFKITNTYQNPIGMSIDSNYYYITDFSKNTISEYMIDEFDGSLTPLPIAETHTGMGPTQLVISHNGKFLFVTNQKSDTISVYAIQ